MTSLITQPQLLAAAAADAAEINSAISAAKARAAGPTTGVVAAAQDEVSAAAAKLFGGYAQGYQALLKQASAFHDQFAATLNSAGCTYAAAEAANASAISGAVGRLTSPSGRCWAVTLAGRDAPDDLHHHEIALIMSGSGTPIPSQSFITGMLNYIDRRWSYRTVRRVCSHQRGRTRSPASRT